MSVGAGAVAAVSAVTAKTAQAASTDQFSAISSARPDQIKISLELDNTFAGYIHSVEGGDAVADVVTEKLGGDHLAKKHIGNVKYNDISITFGVGSGKALHDWIKASFDKGHVRKSGAIIAADYNYNVLSVMEFNQALVTELGFPALDAASKDAAKMTLKFKPEYTRKKLSAARLTAPPKGQKAKAWMVSNFRLKIDGLEGSTSRVSKIDAFTIKQTIVKDAVGEQRDYEQEATSVEVPNLAVAVNEFDAGDFTQWHEDFVIKGNNDQSQEKNATLEFLDESGAPVVAVNFKQSGIFKCAPDKMEAGSESIRRVKAEMYCEEMRFEFKQSWA